MLMASSPKVALSSPRAFLLSRQPGRPKTGPSSGRTQWDSPFPARLSWHTWERDPHPVSSPAPTARATRHLPPRTDMPATPSWPPAAQPARSSTHAAPPRRALQGDRAAPGSFQASDSGGRRPVGLQLEPFCWRGWSRKWLVNGRRGGHLLEAAAASEGEGTVAARWASASAPSGAEKGGKPPFLTFLGQPVGL